MKPLAVALFASSCASGTVDVPCDDPESTRVYVATTLYFARQEPVGVSEGFNLDGRVSTEEDEGGCFRPDFTSPTGVQGIDNAFGALLPALETIGGDAIEGLANEAIKSGELLLLFELEDFDSREADSCVHVDVARGRGTPLLGSDGLLEQGQSLDLDQDAPSSRVENVVIASAELLMTPFSLQLPLDVFDRHIDLTLYDGTAWIQLDEEGRAQAIVGGSLSVEEIRSIAADVGENLTETLDAVVVHNADLDPDADGICQGISVTLKMDLTSVHLYQ